MKNKKLVVRIHDYLYYSNIFIKRDSNMFLLGQKINKIFKHQSNEKRRRNRRKEII